MSIIFAGLIISLILYYGPLKKFQWQFLLFLSLVIYIYLEKYFILIIFINAVCIYFASNKIYDLNKNNKKKLSRNILIFNLIINFAVLFSFKYMGNISSLFLPSTSIFIKFSIPLGISFYTFKSSSYIIDVYRGKYDSEKNFLKLLLFMCYIPSLLQGPIDKYEQIKKSLFSKHLVSYELINKGFLLILFGMMKKFLLADKLSENINTIASSYTNYSGLFIFFTMFIFGLQIYADFSGGIDMVRGISYLFGIDLAHNFNSPYLAKSVADYWRRWHMTLGTWMREYVFYPMSISKPMMMANVKLRKFFGMYYGKAFSLMFSTLLVYILIGIWHGSSLVSILFGLYYGIVISLSLVFRPIMKKIVIPYYIKYPLQLIWVNILVTIGRYFSKANTVEELYNMLMWTVNKFFENKDIGFIKNVIQCFYLDNIYIFIPIIFSIIIILIVGIIREQKGDIYKYITQEIIRPFTYAVIFTMIVFIFVFGIIYGDFTDIRFVYMQY